MSSVRHGLSKTRLHRIWHSMYCRCYYPTTNQYNNYGGKGVKVCDEWKHNFVNFYNWAMSNGYNDSLTLDRIDNNKNYCPENCKWSTLEQQNNNRTTSKFITYNGKTQTQIQWCREYNINVVTFSDRIKRGWSIEEALTLPSNSKCKKELK